MLKEATVPYKSHTISFRKYDGPKKWLITIRDCDDYAVRSIFWKGWRIDGGIQQCKKWIDEQGGNIEHR